MKNEIGMMFSEANSDDAVSEMLCALRWLIDGEGEGGARWKMKKMTAKHKVTKNELSMTVSEMSDNKQQTNTIKFKENKWNELTQIQ